jgi:hypothetical protein
MQNRKYIKMARYMKKINKKRAVQALRAGPALSYTFTLQGSCCPAAESPLGNFQRLHPRLPKS